MGLLEFRQHETPWPASAKTSLKHIDRLRVVSCCTADRSYIPQRCSNTPIHIGSLELVRAVAFADHCAPPIAEEPLQADKQETLESLEKEFLGIAAEKYPAAYAATAVDNTLVKRAVLKN